MCVRGGVVRHSLMNRRGIETRLAIDRNKPRRHKMHRLSRTNRVARKQVVCTWINRRYFLLMHPRELDLWEIFYAIRHFF